LKQFFSPETRHTLRVCLENGKLQVRGLFCKSAILSSIYYGFFANDFKRQHHATIAGIIDFHRQKKEGKPIYLLIRNVHRIEKGLIARHFKPRFALKYLSETLEALEFIINAAKDDASLLPLQSWAQSVLSRYFELAEMNVISQQCKSRFEALGRWTGAALIPYQRNLPSPPPVNFDNFSSLCQQRRSVRWFLQKPVPREMLDRALLVAAQSPSACNRQPFQVRIYDRGERVAKIAGIPGGTSGFSENFPAILVFVGQMNAFFDERDRHLIYIDTSLFAMTLMLGLETLGLSSCAINWADKGS